MKKIVSILGFMVVLIAAKVIGSFGGNYAAESKQLNQHELLRMFVNEFVVNNEYFNYPIKVNEETYLISRSIRDEGRSMFLVENYRIIAPVTANPDEIKVAEEIAWQQGKDIFCAGLQERDELFIGYSSVGLIQIVKDSNDKELFSVKIEKSQCL